MPAFKLRAHRGTAPPPSPPLGSLTAPSLDYPSPLATNPTTIAIRIGVDWQTGDVLKLARSASAAMTSSTILTHTLTDADVTAGTISLGLSSITLSGITYFQAYGNHSGVDSSSLSSIVSWGDTTAPVITTSASQSNVETFKLSVGLTTTDTGGVPAIVSDGTLPGWYIDSGADQLQYEVAIVAGAPVLRWISDGVQTYSSPADQDVNNTYLVTIGAIDYGGNKVTKAITATVSAADLTPTSFSFTAVSNATRSTVYIAAETVTIAGLGSGINAPLTAASGLSYSKNGGAYTTSAGTIANGDTLNVKETSSSSYSTGVTGSVTVGTLTVNFTVTTAADPAAAGFTPSSTQPAMVTLGFSGAVATHTGADFVTGGFGLVYVTTDTGSRTITGVKIKGAGTAGADISLVRRVNALTTLFEIWCCPDASPIVSGGAHNVEVTFSAAVNISCVLCGTITNAASSVVSATSELAFSGSNTSPMAAPALTVPAGGVGIAICFDVASGLVLAATTGTLVSSGIQGFGGDSSYNGAISRQITAGSWTPTFTATAQSTNGILAAAWSH